jgi:CopG family nickel-responsive transcriptional regulator
MERFTISLDEALAREFDQLIAARGYSNRSEAVRDLIRGAIESDRQRETPSGHCVANLSYVSNHHERALAERLTGLQHDHHDRPWLPCTATSTTTTVWNRSSSRAPLPTSANLPMR